MPITSKKQEFRELIERRFLPYVIKPSRFLATEWRKGATQRNAPLAVIVSGASYESSLTNPLMAAVAESLIDSGLCDVGWLYPFGAEAQARLSSIEAAPFVTPQLAQLADAELVIVPLSRPAEVFSAMKNLTRAGIVLGENSELIGEKDNRPKLIAVTDSGSCHKSLGQKVFAEVFDQVYALDDLHRALKSMSLSGATLADLSIAESSGQSGTVYFPLNPPGPVVEVSQNRACFRFSETPALSEEKDSTNKKDNTNKSERSEVSGQSIADAILDSGQTEFLLERCHRASASLEIAELLDQISGSLIPERYRVTLSGLSAGQLSGLLPGALRRYRRARVDIKLPSLSDSVNQSLGRPLEIAALIERLKSLQRGENVQVQLSVCLGFPGKSDIEVEETIQTIRTFSQALNPRSGLKISFVHFTPQNSGLLPGASVRDIQEVERLFESIRSRKSRGIALTLLESTPNLLDTLIDRGAFDSLSELMKFPHDSHNPAKRDSAGMTNLLGPYLKYLEADSAPAVTAPCHSPLILSSDSLELAPDFSPQLSDTDDGFGRGRKRSGGAGGAGGSGGGGVAAPTKTRVRFTWTISSLAKFLSHLDNLRALEGALLRSRLLLSYTQGIRPRLKLSFGPPLPVGFTSECELFDAFFELAPTSDEIQRFSKCLPEGFEIIRHETVYTKALSILEEISAASYVVTLPADQSESSLTGKLESALGAPRLIYQRKTKTGVKEIDLRPGIFATEIDQSPDERSHVLKLTLALTDTFTVRPEDFLQAAGIIESDQAPELTVHRSKFHFGRMAALRRPQEVVGEKVACEKAVSENVACEKTVSENVVSEEI